MQTTQKALDIEFVLVPGPNGDIMKQYGAYDYQKAQALPVTLIIDKTGTVCWKYVGKDINDRPNHATILDQLRLIQ